VQDRYAGDVGDFLTYALLRWLIAPGADGWTPSLGIVWYLNPDESHNADGKHVTYLRDGNRVGERLRALDPDLHDRMRVVVDSERSVACVERSGTLPPGTRTYGQSLSLSDLARSDRTTRRARRRLWLDGALAATVGCDVVFADPDNGIRAVDHPVPSHRDRSEKHAYLDELAAFAERGQSLIVYHHADRSAPAKVQAHTRLAELAAAMMQDEIGVVRASRGSTRLFLITGVGSVAEHLAQRLEDLQRSPWSTELAVIGGQRRQEGALSMSSIHSMPNLSRSAPQ
jgi:hypothetical protein